MGLRSQAAHLLGARNLFSVFLPERIPAIPGLPLHGRRITVRRFELADEARRQAWAKFNDLYFTRYNFTPRRPQENLVLFERLRDRIRLALDDTDQNLIGYASLRPVELEAGVMEIALCLSADHVGQGWGREALELLLPWAIRSLNLQRVLLDVDEINQRAIRLYRRLGFEVFGSFWKPEKDPRLAEYSRQIGLEKAFRQSHGRIEILAWRMEWFPSRHNP